MKRRIVCSAAVLMLMVGWTAPVRAGDRIQERSLRFSELHAEKDGADSARTMWGVHTPSPAMQAMIEQAPITTQNVGLRYVTRREGPIERCRWNPCNLEPVMMIAFVFWPNGLGDANPVAGVRVSPQMTLHESEKYGSLQDGGGSFCYYQFDQLFFSDKTYYAETPAHPLDVDSRTSFTGEGRTVGNQRVVTITKHQCTHGNYMRTHRHTYKASTVVITMENNHPVHVELKNRVPLLGDGGFNFIWGGNTPLSRSGFTTEGYFTPQSIIHPDAIWRTLGGLTACSPSMN